jgi:hypothetical protein
MGTVFNEMSARKEIQLAEKMRQKKLWPLAMALMAKYANGSELEFSLNYGDDKDLVISAGAARIAHVSANSTCKTVGGQPKDLLIQGVIRKLNTWFNNKPVVARLADYPHTIDGNEIIWAFEHIQDALVTATITGSQLEKEKATKDALEMVRNDFGEFDRTVNPGNAAAASSAGVILCRTAQVMEKVDRERSLRYALQGLNLVEQANNFGAVDPERLTTVRKWVNNIKFPRERSPRKTLYEQVYKTTFDMFPIAQMIVNMYQ